MTKKIYLNVLLVLIPGVVILLPFVCLEIVLRTRPVAVKHTSSWVDGNYFCELSPDPREGFRFKKEGVFGVHHDFEQEGRFDTTYTFENYHRIVPDVEAGRPHFLAVFGCSMMFGTAVNDNQTVPYYLGRLLPAYAPYNFGIPAGTLPNTLYQIENYDLGITQDSGIGVFVYYFFHINRIVYHWREEQARPWGNFQRAAYVWDASQQKAVYRGTMREAYHWAPWWGDIASKSMVLREYLLPINLYTTAEARVVASLAQQTQAAFLAKYPGQRFVFVVVGASQGEYALTKIVNFAREAGVETVVLDQTQIQREMAAGRWVHLSDGHMNPATNERFAQLLKAAIGL